MEIKLMIPQMVQLSKLEPNIGQKKGLPKNPREWTQAEVDLLKDSIRETPSMSSARELLVVPNGDKYVILGGNMRHQAMEQLGIKECPCKIFDANTPIRELKAIVIKDNGKFGKDDWDELANNWSDMPLNKWGMKVWEVPEEEDEPTDLDETDVKEKPFVVKMTFLDSVKMTAFVNKYKKVLQDEFDCRFSESGGGL